MDRKELVKWLAGIVARGLAWFFAIKLGMGAVEAGVNATAVAEAIGALIIAGIAIYSSVAGRKKLKAE